MSDIVKRAREYAHNLGGDPQDYLVWQLADEIERVTRLLDAFHDDGTAADNERLTKVCEGLAQAAMNNGQDLLLKEAEIERLKALADTAEGCAGLASIGIDVYAISVQVAKDTMAKLIAAEAEIKRLRAALEGDDPEMPGARKPPWSKKP
jgi:hypothetical protein